MNERIKQLRIKSLDAIPTLNLERAKLMTEFYQTGAAHKLSAPIARAKAFMYLMENKTICINEGELIVGERGPAAAATPTYPEICVHSDQDLTILDTREKISFKVTEQARAFNNSTVAPFWTGRSIRDKIFSKVDDIWKEAYSAGIFTEFMEQRAPGHTVAGKNIFEKGMADFKHEIKVSLENLDFFHDDEAFKKKEQLHAMDIAADALILFAKRHAELARELAEKEEDESRKAELFKIAEICNYVPENAPRTVHEALQHYWFIHLGVITELSTWDAFNPGHLDQNIWPMYEREVINNKSSSKEEVKELLMALWVKFHNQPAPPKVGVTAEESNTYTDFANINLGGLKPDGSDAVNELSYLILDVIEEMRLLQPSSNVQISKKTPDRFIKRTLDILKTGFGQPSIFNTDAIIQELTRQGKSLIDARLGGASGCVEVGAFGKEAYILTGYFNLPKILEITLNNGVDPRTGKLLGLSTGDPTDFTSFDELMEAFKTQVNFFVDIKIKGNRIIERLWAEQLPAVFLSILIEDCIKNGKDYNDGGARYNSTYIQMVGIGSLTDSLSSLKYNVFDTKRMTMDEMITLLKTDFDNQIHHSLLLTDTPKYGNDDDYADSFLTDIFEILFAAVDGRPNTRGGEHRINLLPTTCHVYFGKVTGATPDGRKAGVPLSEGISPVQGADLKGPTAVIKSASKIDHLRTGGTLLNQKFTPTFMADSKGIEKVTHLIRAYFKMDGHHIQFNVVSADTLRKAQKNPQDFRNLIVRVAGYSDYFINLGKDLQDEIIARTEHQSF
ncbi:MAG: glycyl radical protein [Candidatus Heimdallarchaeota archaeon]|nr:glycyl radical protein [Candidatus Heimdallarchaeota archaeon]